MLVGVADELRQLEYGQRLKHRERNVLSGGAGRSTGRALFDHALAGGARALAQASVGLRPGARADIVTLDTTHPSLAGRSGDAAIDGWIFAAGTGAIDCVWAGGNKVVEGGRHRLRQKRARTLQRGDAEACRMSLATDAQPATSRRSTSGSAPISSSAS